MIFIRAVLLAGIVLLTRLAVAQSFQGQIGDNLTYKPLPEASIKVKDKPIYCQVSPNGSFQVDLSDAIATDLVVIRCPGYKPKLLLKQELIDAWYDIKLSPVYPLGLTEPNPDKTEYVPAPLATNKPVSIGPITQ
ncbi:hypothetical protein [Spirosoma gilvum]